MDRLDFITGRIVANDAVEQAIDALSGLRFYTDYPAMKLERVGKENVGDQWQFDCVFYFDKLLYLPYFESNRLVRQFGESVVVEAYWEYLKRKKSEVEGEIANRLQKRPPLQHIVGWNEADDYTDIRGRVQSISFGKPEMERHEIVVDGRVRMVIDAKVLPAMAQGPYNLMSDALLRQWIHKWGSEAPENFWMDGEYRGTAAQRVKDLMRQWRGMTPRQQEKHFDDLRK